MNKASGLLLGVNFLPVMNDNWLDFVYFCLVLSCSAYCNFMHLEGFLCGDLEQISLFQPFPAPATSFYCSHAGPPLMGKESGRKFPNICLYGATQTVIT